MSGRLERWPSLRTMRTENYGCYGEGERKMFMQRSPRAAEYVRGSRSCLLGQTLPGCELHPDVMILNLKRHSMRVISNITLLPSCSFKHFRICYYKIDIRSSHRMDFQTLLIWKLFHFLSDVPVLMSCFPEKTHFMDFKIETSAECIHIVLFHLESKD